MHHCHIQIHPFITVILIFLSFSPVNSRPDDFIKYHPVIRNYKGYPSFYGFIADAKEIASEDIHVFELAENSGQMTGGSCEKAFVGGWNSSSGEFKMAYFNILYPTGGGPHLVVVGKVEKISDPGTIMAIQPGTPFQFFTFRQKNHDTLLCLCVVTGENSMRFFSVAINETGTDIFKLSLLTAYTINSPVGKKIIRIVPEYKDDTTFLWALGYPGLIRRIRFSEPIDSTDEVNFDIPPFIISGIITNYCQDYFCSSRGVIYKLSGSVVNQVDTVCTTPLNYINQTITVGDQGVFVINNGKEWKKYSYLDKRYCIGYACNNELGNSATVIDTSWQDYTTVYQDLPTVISQCFPDSVFNKINNGYLTCNAFQRETITIKTSDPEGNNQMPLMSMHRGDSIVPIKIKEIYPPNCSNKYHPMLKDGQHRLYFSKDSIVYGTTTKQWVQMSVNGWSLIELPYLYAILFQYKDTFLFSVCTDTLRILNDALCPVVQQQTYYPYDIFVKQKGQHLIVSNIEGFTTLSIYSLSGKLMKTLSIRPDNHCELSCPFSSQIIFMKFSGKMKNQVVKFIIH